MSRKAKALNIIEILFVIILALILGAISGLHLTKWVMGDFSTVSYEGNEYLPNGKEVVLNNTGKHVSQISPVDNYIIAEYYLSQYDNYQIYYNGTVSSGPLNQIIQGTKIKNENIYFIEKLSDGIKKVADRTIIDMENNIVQTQNGRVGGEEELHGYYEDEKITTMTYDQYLNKSATLVTMASSFIVSDKTLLSGTMTQDGMTYTINLNLDPIKAAAFYAKDATNISGYTILDIEYVRIEAKIDANQYFQYIKYECEYRVDFAGLPITVVDESTLTFAYDNVEIPSMEEV